MTSDVLDASLSEPFFRKPGWRLWCEQVQRDVKGVATPEEAAELRKPWNLVAWMRGLNYLLADVDAHIADSKRRLALHRPLPGTRPSPEYLALKAEYDDRHARRLRFKRGVDGRLEEVRYLLDVHEETPRATAGYLTTVLGRVQDLLERDDLEAALSLARATLDSAADAEWQMREASARDRLDRVLQLDASEAATSSRDFGRGYAQALRDVREAADG